MEHTTVAAALDAIGIEYTHDEDGDFVAHLVPPSVEGLLVGFSPIDDVLELRARAVGSPAVELDTLDAFASRWNENRRWPTKLRPAS